MKLLFPDAAVGVQWYSKQRKDREMAKKWWIYWVVEI
jgi:hypothetical protein